MKKTIKFLLPVAFLLPLSILAQNASVLLQHAGKPSVFTGHDAIQDAQKAAVNGDTLYLGLGFWSSFTLEKSLHIYGAGISPDSTMATGRSGINGNINMAKGSNHSHLEGFAVIGDINIGTSDSVQNIGLSRMMANSISFGASGGKSKNISVSECIIQGSIVGNDNVSNIVIRNNIISGVLGSMSNSALIENNILFFQQPYNQTIQGVNGAIIRNNVFAFNQTCCYGLMAGTGNVFHNNVVPLCPAYPAGTDTLNNYYGLPLDSVLVKPGIPFSWSGDYHIKPWRLSVLKGQDGSQAGIYGGKYGAAKEGRVPVIPHIQSNNVDATTDASGKLKVNIKVQAQKR